MTTLSEELRNHFGSFRRFVYIFIFLPLRNCEASDKDNRPDFKFDPFSIFVIDQNFRISKKDVLDVNGLKYLLKSFLSWMLHPSINKWKVFYGG